MKRLIANRTVGSLVLASALALGISCTRAPLREPARTPAREVKAKAVPLHEYELLRCVSTAPRDCPKEVAQHKAMVGIKNEFCRITKLDAARLASSKDCGPVSKLQMSLKLNSDGVIKVMGSKSESGGCTEWPGANAALNSVGNDVRLPPSKGCGFDLEAYFRKKR